MITLRRLEVPDLLSIRRLEGKNGRQVQIVAASGTSKVTIPGRAVPRSNVDQVELRVVDDRVPGRPTTAAFPPPALPRAGSDAHGFRFKNERGIARDGEGPPDQSSSLRVVCRHVSANSHLSAAVPDQHHTLRDSGRARDRVGLRRVDGCGFPYSRARPRVDGDEATVQGPDEDFAAVDCHAAIHRVATEDARTRSRYQGVVGPPYLPRSGIDRVHHAPRPGGVEDAIDHEG